MSQKNQRKEIIKQIKYLSQSRQKVNIDAVDTHGLNFIDKNPNIVPREDVGQDTIFNWDVVSYY